MLLTHRVVLGTVVILRASHSFIPHTGIF